MTSHVNDRRFQAHRQRLLSLLAHLERRTKAVEQDLRHAASPLPTDPDDQSIELENDDVLARLAKEGPAQIRLIRGALERMDRGSYGICVDCDGPIGSTRLEALPYALTCIACAERRESTAR